VKGKNSYTVFFTLNIDRGKRVYHSYIWALTVEQAAWIFGVNFSKILREDDLRAWTVAEVGPAGEVSIRNNESLEKYVYAGLDGSPFGKEAKS